MSLLFFFVSVGGRVNKWVHGSFVSAGCEDGHVMSNTAPTHMGIILRVEMEALSNRQLKKM